VHPATSAHGLVKGANQLLRHQTVLPTIASAISLIFTRVAPACSSIPHNPCGYSLRADVEFCWHAARNRLLLIRNLRLPVQICEKLVPADGTRLPTKSETTISAIVVLKGSSRTVKSVKQNETDLGAEENDIHHNFYFYFSASARRSVRGPVPVGQRTTSRAVPRARQSPA